MVSCGPLMGSLESGWVVFFESKGCVVRRLWSVGCGWGWWVVFFNNSGGQLSWSSRIACSVYGRSMPVKRAGLLRVNGPLGNRCAGSAMSTFSPAGASAYGSAGASFSRVHLPVMRMSASMANPRRNSSCARSPSVHPLFRPSSMRILKRIPHASQHLAASKLASILVDVSQKNDSESWGHRFNFSSRCLAVHKSGGHRRSLASAINVQLREESDPLPSQFCQSSKYHFPRDSASNLAKQVSSKLEEGDVRVAVRISSSEDTLAELNEETLSALRAKHPPQPPGSCFPLAPAVNTSLPLLAEVEIVQAIRSFPSNSAGGPDGLHPQHLVDLTSASAERGGRELLTALSSFIVHILEGNTPPSIQPIFFGANLIALNKKDGGIRPIAVGQTLRRLVAKCASGLMMRSSEISLAPRQFGYGTSLGC